MSKLPRRLDSITDVPKGARQLYQLDGTGDDDGLSYRLGTAGQLLARIRDAYDRDPHVDPAAPVKPIAVARPDFALAVSVGTPAERCVLLRWAGQRSIRVE